MNEVNPVKRANKVVFNCFQCGNECSQPKWEYKKNKNHFCSQKCAKIFRNRHIALMPQRGDKKECLTFLNSFIKKTYTYFNCICDCGNHIAIHRSKFGKQKTCGDRKNHKGELSPIFNGYEQISNTYWESIKHGARERNLNFDITIQDAWDLFIEQDKKCAFTGMLLNLSKNKNLEVTASIDRIDSSKGYVIDNIQWVHKKLNVMKMNLSNDDFISWCTEIANSCGMIEKLDFKDVLIKPKKSTVKSRSDVDLIDNGLSDIIPGVIPIIASNMDTVGCFSMAKELFKFNIMTCLHKHYSVKQYIDFFHSLDDVEKSYVFYSTGIVDTDLIKLKQVYEICGIKNICLDVANAYITPVFDFVSKIKELIKDCIIMVGNIATPDIIEEYAKLKVSILKCGIGSGKVCTTRNMTGIGVPQLSCILDCVKEATNYNIKICSDGGCTESSDICKAFGAGASAVMLGSIFAGHDECEGEWEYENEEKKYLKFYGMASREAMNKYYGGVAHYRASEGKCISVPYKGAVKDTVQQILGGIRSACTYIGANKLKDFSKCTTFIKCK